MHKSILVCFDVPQCILLQEFACTAIKQYQLFCSYFGSFYFTVLHFIVHVLAIEIEICSLNDRDCIFIGLFINHR